MMTQFLKSGGRRSSRTCVIKHDDTWDGADKVSEGAKRKALVVDALAEFSIEPGECVT
jgi:hypothetical protein